MGQSPSLPGPLGTRFRVIGAGMSRTGTKTLNEALTILLDGPVHDSGIQSLGGPMEQIQAWLDIMELAPKAQTFSEQKKLDWLISEVLDGYVATMDCPAATLTPEIMRVYPDAIVIATTRNQVAWWKSMNYLNSMMGTWYLPLVVLWLHKTQVYGVWRERFHQIMKWRYQQEKIEEDTLRKHEDHLRQVVPPEKLFFYEVSQGWEPLCQILNVPIPDRPFPHNNSKGDAAQTFRDHVLIDFGYTEEPRVSELDAVRENIADMAELMIDAMVEDYSPSTSQVINIQVNDADGVERDMEIETDPGVQNIRHVHRRLKHLILRCQAEEEELRPSLEELLETCEEAVQIFEPHHCMNIRGYDYSVETDDAIRDIIQQNVLDADT
ncbi:hypothetical protein F4677DRAFT_461540 [Hypoxylon crocopeplum]|nr:hypothetical protein F4677DRAFT_461540 [Hypoxylon crocopeplum]